MRRGTRIGRSGWMAAAWVAAGLVALSLLGRTTVSAQEFRVSPMDARFSQAQQMTEYEVLVAAPAGSNLTYN